MFTVRAATLDDIPAVVRVFMRLSPHKDQQVVSECEAKTELKAGNLFVAFREGNRDVVVAAMILAWDFCDNNCQLRRLACRSDDELEGAGAELVNSAAGACREHNIPKLWGWAMEYLKYHEKAECFGFTEIYRMRTQFFGMDAYFLGRVIEIEKGAS